MDNGSIAFCEIGFDQNGSVIIHYGVLGMKWGVRKDKIKASLHRGKEKLVKSNLYNSKPIQFLAKNTYALLDAEDLDGFIGNAKEFMKSPQRSRHSCHDYHSSRSSHHRRCCSDLCSKANCHETEDAQN